MSYFTLSCNSIPNEPKGLINEIELSANLRNEIKNLCFITFLDGSCNSCIEKIEDWKDFFKQNSKLSKLNILFIVFGPQTQTVIKYIRENNETSIIRIVPDPNLDIVSLGKNYQFIGQTVLVNKDLQVLYKGSPLVKENLVYIYDYILP